MSISVGSLLIGIAALLVVGTYLARPFRSLQAGLDQDQLIELWIDQAYKEKMARMELDDFEVDPFPTETVQEHESVKDDQDKEVINFCPQCGRQSRPGDRFCAKCGNPLKGGA